MADIEQLEINGTVHDIADATARKDIEELKKSGGGVSEEKVESVVNEYLAKEVEEELTGETTKGFIALTSSTAYKITSNAGYTTVTYTLAANITNVTIKNATYSNSSAPSYIFVNGNDKVVLTGKESASDTGKTVTVPSGSNKLIVTRQGSEKPNVIGTVRKDKYADEDYINNKVADTSSYFELVNETIINRIVKAEVRQNFKYTFDKPFITFCFDDALQDIDLVASIFAEFDVPLCMALIPSNINNTCNGLTEEANRFTVGMTVKDVAIKAVENGGEVLSHGYTPITANNINNASIIKEIFSDNKKVLENCGFTVRGIMQNGGTNALLGGTKEEGGYIFQYYAGQNFDYSDRYGITEDYYHPRVNMNVSLDTAKGYIDIAKANNKWVSFFAHSITGIYNETNVTEANLRALLQYCQDNNIDIVTYSFIYDNYGK